MLAVFGIAFVGVLGYQLWPQSAPPRPTKSTTTVAKSAGPSSSRPARSTKRPPAQKLEMREVDIDIDELLAEIKEVDFNYEAERTARNPMSPLVGMMAPRPPPGPDDPRGDSHRTVEALVAVMNMAVTGIVWDPLNPLAVIDNEVISQGYEYSSGVMVHSIERDRVVFRVGGSEVEVELKEQYPNAPH